MEQQVQMTFEEKLQKLAELAKIKKNVLENREILDFFRGEILDPEKLGSDLMIFWTVSMWMYCVWMRRR